MAQVRCYSPTPPPSPPTTTELTLVAMPSAAITDRPDDAAGPGWFASSWELRRGLDVREGLPTDANLNEWLTVCLGRESPSAQRAAARATASPSSITAIA